MKLYSLYFILLLSLVSNTLFSQLELNPQNKLLLNSSHVTGSDFSIGVNSTQGGIMINSSSTTNTGITGYSLNGVIKGYSGFNHVKERYDISVGGANRVGITADVTSIYNLLQSYELNTADKFTVGGSMDSLFTIDAASEKMFFNYNQTIWSADFVLNSTSEVGYGGMFIHSEDQISGRPYYGYAVDGNISAFHNYSQTDQKWHLYVNNTEMLEIASDVMRIGDDLEVGSFAYGIPAFHVEEGIVRSMYFNTDTQIGAADFTLNSEKQTEFGGMYINSPDVTAGKPFYGYATGGVPTAYHYYDDLDDIWNLNVGGTLIIRASDDNVQINGPICVSSNTSIKPPGTIFYDGSNFIGVIANGVTRQLDNTVNAQGTTDSKQSITTEIQLLETENKALLEKVENLEGRLDKLEKALINSGIID